MQFLKNVRVAIRLPLVVIMALVALVGFALVAMSTLNTVKIGGPEEAKVSEQNALLADILPPPGYLVETQLAAMQLQVALAVGDDAAVKEDVATIEGLAESFRERMTFWLDALGGTEQEASIRKIGDTGEEYLAALQDEIIPAFESGDAAAVDAAAVQMEALFVAHRAAVQVATGVITAVTTAQVEHATSLTASRSRMMWILLIATLVVVGAAAIAVTLSVVRPLGELRSNMEEIASGDEADNHARLDTDRRDEFGQLATAFNEFADKLAVYSAEVEQNARLAGARAVEVAQAATAAAVHMNTVAGATTQLTAAAAEIARSAGEASQTAETAVKAAGHADEIMERLADSSAAIEHVVTSIRGIAGQTTMLALNATIEASRAGEAGRGFAVVASEVKELAGETGSATSDIVVRIEAIRLDTQAALAALDQVTTVIAEISASQTMIAAAVEEHAATTAEIDRSLADAVAAVNQLADPTYAADGEDAGRARTLVGAIQGFD